MPCSNASHHHTQETFSTESARGNAHSTVNAVRLFAQRIHSQAWLLILRTYLTKILYLHLNILKKTIYANYLMISGARLWGGLGQRGNWSCMEPAKAYPPTREHWNKGEQTVPDTQQPLSASHNSSTGCWSVVPAACSSSHQTCLHSRHLCLALAL